MDKRGNQRMVSLGQIPGKLIGYQIGLDRCASQDTRILYMTAGIAMNKMINEREPPITHIIIGNRLATETINFFMAIRNQVLVFVVYW